MHTLPDSTVKLCSSSQRALKGGPGGKVGLLVKSKRTACLSLDFLPDFFDLYTTVSNVAHEGMRKNLLSFSTFKRRIAILLS